MWAADLAQELVDAGVDAAALVPDKRLDPIIAALRGHGTAVRALTAEEECVAYAAGRRLAGGHAVVMMQSSGVGNCLNALASFVVPYAIGVPLVISMRGTLGERNPSQVPMGRAAAAMLEALGIQAFRVTDAAAVRRHARGIARMADAGIAAAMLLGQELDDADR